MIEPEHQVVLDAMAPHPNRVWRSTELKKIIWARFHGLHDRKVRRVLEDLEHMCLLERQGDGPATSWRLLAKGPREAIRPPVDLSLALLKLRQLAKHHLPNSVIGDFEGYFEGATRVLHESSFDTRLESARAWMGKTARLDPGYPLIPPQVQESMFETIWAALYRDESLYVRYQKADQDAAEPKEHRVLPYAIVEKGPYWYLVVRGKRSSGKQGEAFLLRFDRIIEVRNLGHDLVRESDFNLDAFIKKEKVLEWFPEEPEQIVLRVRETRAVPSQFRSVKLSIDQKIEPEEGGFVLTATAIRGAQEPAPGALAVYRSPRASAPA
ncbi:helix-turn-helix transcriptional regulator [Cupriavidus sp. CuC1]|uniref:helix-turn-helix transcriptional regulator n=1 Tax=Cupriavidus sp. CuC1 TaxID=3373131 RepID=UPI0037CE24E5